MKCWICGGGATTGEHKIKRSDMRSVLRPPTQADPLYFHDHKTENRWIGSLDAKILKSPGRICACCNNTRTQPHDRAWERMSAWLRTRTPAIAPGAIVRGNRIFPYDTAGQTLNVHLFFLKQFGCLIVEGGISIDPAGFANAILKNRAHPHVYLKFGCAPSLDGNAIVGRSDVKTATRSIDGSCAFATWLYHVGDLAVNVMFAADGEQREGLVGAWHPRFGTNRLVIADFQ
jgi:hypothetical protein